MSNIVLARLGENIKASVAGNILVSSGPTTAPTLNALVGSIALFAGTAAPTGWLKCDGTGGLLRSQYQALWDFAFASNNIVDEAVWIAANGPIGSFSRGNGSTTFRIPDLRGEFVRALADGKAVDTGRVIGTAQTDTFQGHEHTQAQTAITSANTGNGYVAANNSLWFNFFSSTTSAIVEKSPNGVPRTATETRPRNIALLYCIKF